MKRNCGVNSQGYNEPLFQAFLDNREEVSAKKKKVNTDRAVKMLRRKLTEWAFIGFNVDQIIENSITNGWTGLFVPKGMVPKQQIKRPTGQMQKLTEQIAERHQIPQAKTYQEKHDHARKVRKQAEEARATLRKMANLNSDQRR